MHLPTCTKHAGPSTTGDTSPLSSKRKSCNRSTSPYFGTALTTGIPSGSGARRESRSRHFKSSPDSCHGSAISFDWGSAFTERAFVALKACKQFEKLGVRHICRNKCYFRAYEPFRKWHALRLKVAATGSSTRVLAGWSVQMDGGQEARLPWRIKYVSPDVSFSSADVNRNAVDVLLRFPSGSGVPSENGQYLYVHSVACVPAVGIA